MRRFVLAALLLAAVPAVARIETSPRVVSPRGGEVRITTGCATCTVIVDGMPVPSTFANGVITFQAPAHAAGPATLALLGNNTYETGELLYDFEREMLLIPIAHEPLPGAYGAQWVSDIHVENRGDEPIPLGPYICSFTANVFPCSTPPRTIAPNTTIPLPGRPFFGTRALLVPKEMLDDLAISARVRDASREPEGAGTRIPVVRESDWKYHSFSLIHVPTDPRYRSWLRVYSYASKVIVRVFSEAGAELDARMFQFFPPTDSNFYGVHQWADVLASARNRGETHVRISIEPEVHGNWGATWAMLTLTENDTQRVLVYAPH